MFGSKLDKISSYPESTESLLGKNRRNSRSHLPYLVTIPTFVSYELVVSVMSI